LRTTAEPTARLTTKPTFAGSPERTAPGVPAASSKWPASTEPPARRPVRCARRKSSGRLILDCCGSTTPPAQPGRLAWRPAQPFVSFLLAEASRVASLVRRSAARGPYDGVRRGQRGQPGCASAAGSHGLSPADGCSAGTYACSLELQVQF
jgi:hypothetical protein